MAVVAGWLILAKPAKSPAKTDEIIVKEKKLTQYSYPSLKNRQFAGSEIIIDKIIKDEQDFVSYLFYFKVQSKKVSGLINIPKEAGTYPVIVMIRGYVDKEIYQTGIGTSHGGEVLAQNGFITLAPDFLGYGASDLPSPEAMEDRFLTYVTVLELLNSISNLNSALAKASITARTNNDKVGIWGHSNGGQIAISTLEITSHAYPTVLWAPVTKPFPYSILYYTDDIEDHGKALRRVVADFELEYDIEQYSLTNYVNWIKAPIQIHQGSADQAVPQTWSDSFVKELQTKEKIVEYFVYVGDDHNFANGNWNTVIGRTIAFYKKSFADQ